MIRTINLAFHVHVLEQVKITDHLIAVQVLHRKFVVMFYGHTIRDPHPSLMIWTPIVGLIQLKRRHHRAGSTASPVHTATYPTP